MVVKANYPVDLHTHSNRSDGADSPYEWLCNVKESGLKIAALTDHDIIPPTVIDTPSGTVDFAECGKEMGIKAIRGIEISCDTDVEDVHLVCFRCDWEDKFFTDLMEDVRLSKIESYRLLVDRLFEDGYNITWEEVLSNNGNPVSEDNVQKKMIFELIARKGYTEDWSAAKLMIKNTPRYSIKRRKPDPLKVIKEVHRTGGIVIDAHPFLINEPVMSKDGEITRYEYIERMIEAGLDGIEACYTYDKTSYSDTRTKEEIEKYIRETYEERLPIISGGSDYHNDRKKNSKKVRDLGECGVTEEYFYGNPILSELVD